METDLDGERGVREEVIELCGDERRNCIDGHGQASVVRTRAIVSSRNDGEVTVKSESPVICVVIWYARCLVPDRYRPTRLTAIGCQAQGKTLFFQGEKTLFNPRRLVHCSGNRNSSK